MMNHVPSSRWSDLSALVARAMGLHFPPARWDDLQRGMAGAAREFGFDATAPCIDWLLSTPPTRAQLQVLASHLTIGETYFFRDRQVFDTLAREVLPALIRARRGREQRLRFWSTACCSGEEAYSLAMLLHRTVPDLQDWQVTITATDINPHFLRKAVDGVYGEWSFRNAPAGLKQRHFERTADGRFAIAADIKRMVTFAHLNLVEDVYPSLATDTNAMDVILCRNVLMYFTPSQVRKVIGNLHHCLVEGGWLAVSASEVSQALFARFATAAFPGVTLYRKDGERARIEPPMRPAQAEGPAPRHAPAPRTPAPAAAAPPPPRSGSSAPHATPAPTPADCSRLARALANQGDLGSALQWCERWIAADKLDPASHYLRAVVLLEQGDPAQASASLTRALYLDPQFVLAHFALGNLARSRGRLDEADRHFANALRLLRACSPDDILPESDGLTAGRLAETLSTLIDA